VLITPETYQEMVEALEDYKLYIEAEKRMKNATEQDFISEEDVMNKFGITQKDLDSIDDVELD
jgi:predicted DNA-binding protein